MCTKLQILICFTFLQYDKLWGLPRRVFTLLLLFYVSTLCLHAQFHSDPILHVNCKGGQKINSKALWQEPWVVIVVKSDKAVTSRRREPVIEAPGCAHHPTSCSSNKSPPRPQPQSKQSPEFLPAIPGVSCGEPPPAPCATGRLLSSLLTGPSEVILSSSTPFCLTLSMVFYLAAL